MKSFSKKSPPLYPKQKRKASGTERTRTTSTPTTNTSMTEPGKSNRTAHHSHRPIKQSRMIETENETCQPDFETEDDDEKPETGVGNESTQKICMAVLGLNGSIACAYYDPVTQVIYVLEDTRDSVNYDLMKIIIEQADPEIVITSSKADDKFIDSVQDQMIERDRMFTICNAKDFAPTKGRNHLLRLPLFSNLPPYPEMIEISPFHDRDQHSDLTINDPHNQMDDPNLKRWRASIRLSNYAALDFASLCLSCIGALLDYISRERAISDLEEDDTFGVNIHSIQSLALDQFMQLNADALLSLQVFQTEDHASIHSDKTKEGLSLFGMLDSTKTALGRSLLRRWLLRPSLSVPVIQARHDAVACFTSPENIPIASAMHSHLKGIKNIPRILGMMKAGKARINEWEGLVKFTIHSALLRESLGDLQDAHKVEIVRQLIGVLDVDGFRVVGNAVNGIIDWEESTMNGRICVKPHIDEDLDNRKHVYAGIDHILSKVAEQISSTVPPDYASTLNVVYFPQLGFLICVPMQEEWKHGDGIRTINDWSFQFTSESHVYFKSQHMHDMDKHIGDLHSAIVDREIEIVQGLLEEVLTFSQVMENACDVCAELDCLLAFAVAANKFNYKRPTMVDTNVMNVKGGRHPLQEQVVDVFVPNDCFLVGGRGLGTLCSDVPDSYTTEDEVRDGKSILVCTGANACGKSVYLKQAALIQIMAQIGCFVPAESAALGIVDGIFTRIQTRETVARAQSAFMIDLNQVSFAIRSSTSRSLIILDEFGKGTLSTDGAGLFCGLLKSLLNRGPDCPKVLAATHFHDMFSRRHRSPIAIFEHDELVLFAHMQVTFANEHGDVIVYDVKMNAPADDAHDETAVSAVGPGDRITYLYRVAPGLSTNSQAAQCAALFGMPPQIVRRGQWVTQLLRNRDLNPLLDESMTEEEERDLRDAEAVCRRYLKWDFTEDEEDKSVNVKDRLREVLGRCQSNDNEEEQLEDDGYGDMDDVMEEQ